LVVGHFYASFLFLLIFSLSEAMPLLRRIFFRSKFILAKKIARLPFAQGVFSKYLFCFVCITQIKKLNQTQKTGGKIEPRRKSAKGKRR
jgi:ArsR family metal-binding transcriptional regulator